MIVAAMGWTLEDGAAGRRYEISTDPRLLDHEAICRMSSPILAL